MVGSRRFEGWGPVMHGTCNKDQTRGSALGRSSEEQRKEKYRELCGCNVVHLQAGWGESIIERDCSRFAIHTDVPNHLGFV